MSKATEDSSHLIGLGRISGAHGIRGAVKVRPDATAATTDPEDFLALGEVVVGGRPYRVISADRLKNQVLLRLAGVDDRNRAEALAGLEVLGDRRRFPKLPSGEFYWFQLLGLPVYHAGDGSRLGYLRAIMPTPAHDVYVVADGDREILLPAVEDVIVAIDLEQGLIKVAPPEGLLEAYAD